MFESLLGYVFVISLVIMIPGLDTANVFRSLLVSGRKAALATSLGTSVGLLVWGLAASLGISALITASEIGYTILKWIGGAYLLYLGVRMIIDSRKITQESIDIKGAAKTSQWRSFSRSLVINLTNPKAVVFYGAVFPQFLPHGIPTFWGGMILTGIHAILNFVWFGLLILGAGFVQNKLRTPKVQKIIERVSGLALIGFGLKVATESK